MMIKPLEPFDFVKPWNLWLKEFPIEYTNFTGFMV